jgi:hypothetical protein
VKAVVMIEMGRCMKDDSLSCSVCGGLMAMVGIVPTKLGRSKRYHCTCGNHVEVNDETCLLDCEKSEPLMPEGIQEFV